MKNLILVVVLVFVFTFGMTTTTQSYQSSDILSTYHVNVEDSVMRKIAEKFEVTHKLQNGYEILVPFNQTEELLKLDPNAQLIEEDSSLELRKIGFDLSSPRQYMLFHVVLEKVKALEAQYPDLVQYVEYGKSAEGRPLFAVKISDNVTQDEDEPELMITATTHGDEIITTEVAMGLIERLLSGSAHDERFLKMINEHELYFIPVVNVDGYVNRTRYDQGSDPNRSYPYPGKPNAKSTPSIAGLIEFFKSRNFVGSLDFHAYGKMTMYPWAYTYNSVPQKDREIFDGIAKRMAETNGHKYGPISEVIYIAVGSSADFYYWTRGTLALAIEMGHSKAPHPNEIEKYTDDQAESTWRFIESF